jgi:anti-sigma factor RsiW
MSSGLPLPEDDLHAYADNRLPPERAQEVWAVLARDPARSAPVA